MPVSELHLYEGTEFESARDSATSDRASAPVRKTTFVGWFRRAAAHLLLRKSYS